MIHVALNFLRQYLNKELNLKLGLSTGTDSVKISPVNKDTAPDNKIHLTLINIEEEKILKNQNYYRKVNSDSDFLTVINPEIKVNLYILASAQFEAKNYTEALKQISYVITIFQGKNVFNQPDLTGDAQILETLIVDLYSQTIEQINGLWQSMGTNPVPAVMYKVRLLLIQDDKMLDQAPEVKGIGIDLVKKL
jgi:hypothetical protein